MTTHQSRARLLYFSVGWPRSFLVAHHAFLFVFFEFVSTHLSRQSQASELDAK